jgi:hypothetical protein
VLARLASHEGNGYLKWIRASLGNAMKLIATEDVLYFQAEDKYTKVRAPAGDAHQETDQGTVRGTGPGSVLADTSRDHHQPARHRENRTRLARPAIISLRDRGEKLTVSRTFAHRFKAM